MSSVKVTVRRCRPDHVPVKPQPRPQPRTPQELELWGVLCGAYKARFPEGRQLPRKSVGFDALEDYAHD